MTDIRDTQNAFARNAELLGNYEAMSKTELANGYCDADEAAERARAEGNIREASKQEALRSEYFSALMLRYWYKIFEWSRNSSSLNLELTDFVSWLSKSLYVAFYYRMWRYEYEAEVKEGKFIKWKLDADGNRIPNKYYYIKDNTAPDKVINRCCGSMRGRVYQYYNKDKRKASVQTSSIDAMTDENGDSALAYSNCYEQNEFASGAKCLVGEFLRQDKGLEALIADGIMNHDTMQFKVDKKHPEAGKVFNARKLVKHLNLINQEFMQEFCEMYSIEESKGESILNKLKSFTNPKLYKYIDKTLIEIKETPEMLDLLTDK